MKVTCCLLYTSISLFVEEWLKKYTKAEIVRDEFEEGRFNVMAKLKGEAQHPNLLYLAHMDTVPVGNGWTKDPFGGEIEGNKLYGRGSCAVSYTHLDVYKRQS